MENDSNKREWLTLARKNKGLTQQQLGDLIGTSSNAITQYEKGKRFPKPNILAKLCKELDLKIEMFYD